MYLEKILHQYQLTSDQFSKSSLTVVVQLKRKERFICFSVFLAKLKQGEAELKLKCSAWKNFRIE